MARYGGQAVFEGVMMRGDGRSAVAVRRPDGGIEVRLDDLPTWGRRFERVPVARGVAALAEALPLGFRALTWSAEHGLGQVRTRAPRWWERVFTLLVVAVVIVVGSVAPAVAATWVASSVFGLSVLAPVVETVLGVLGLYVYLRLVGRLGDVVRLFENHGAEHKVVNAFEAGAPLTVESVQRYSTRHVRCGTSFLLVVAVVSAAFFAAVGGSTSPVLRVLALPLIAGVAAEIQLRLAESRSRVLTLPGLALQRFTTREPSDAQVEVAIAALVAVLPRHEAAVPAAA